MTKNGRVSQVPVGQHKAVQAEFQRICFIFVAVHDVDRDPASSQADAPGCSREQIDR
ncbi:hypothetical protein AB0L65_59095 [Nonomuraea sp. NPDC052116]|uniref:hypothetical protein n=1 Tax=Nonomuraea sp. NPDC052116 TaxID=3155665 RepID=UPI00343345C3